MPQDPAAALSSLLRASSIQDHDEILNAANAALKANKNDVASQHVKVVALLNLNRFDDALRIISAGGGKLDAACALEKAYALYKTGALDEASEVLKTTGVKERGFSHVAAQIHYRAERFGEARDLYENLLGAGAGAEENDININTTAALAQGLWQDSASQFQAKSAPAPDTFMLCFNAGCAAMARGEFDASLKLLQQAIRLCDASDDLTQEDKQAEMRPLLAQQAYVYAKMGKRKQALDLYRSLGSTE
jgi:signal recognition particle subunit SRP72